MKYKLILTKDRTIRPEHGVQKNGINISGIGTLTKNATNSGDVVWNCLVDGEEGFLNAKAGDSWLHLTVPREGWVAIRHNGEDLCELIEVPDDGEITLKHTVEVYSDGSLKIDGTPYP